MIQPSAAKSRITWFVLLFICFLFSCKKNTDHPDTDSFDIQPPIPPTSLPAPPPSLQLNSFYKKYVDAGGIPIVSSEYTRDEALVKAKETVLVMMEFLPDSVKQQMVATKTRVGVISQYEKTNDIPEYSYLPDSMNIRARGLGPRPGIPVCLTAEENVLCGNNAIGDRWLFMDVLTHEFAHTIHQQGLGADDYYIGFNEELYNIYTEARSKGLWEGTYAASSHFEYWAEGVGLWFNCNRHALPYRDNPYLGTREELKEYDSKLYALVARYFTPLDLKNGCR